MQIEIMILMTVLGAVMGSFLGCMGYRIPNKVKATSPRSFCNDCGKTLKWYMNIPILSYIFLKGRCAYCHKPINFIYPFVEWYVHYYSCVITLCMISHFIFGSLQY